VHGYRGERERWHEQRRENEGFGNERKGDRLEGSVRERARLGKMRGEVLD